MPCDYVLKFDECSAGIAVESYSGEEQAVLERHMTNCDSNVFAWRQSDTFTSEQIGALLSRYSRTSLTGRRLFLKEFYPNKERGREFFAAWLVDYGDDSIQEMVGGLPMACEFVSNLAAKEIEDSRLGSYIEKSTRYVQFDKKLPDGHYMFYRDPDILSTRHGDRYISLMDSLFSSYSAAMPKMERYIRDTNRIEDVRFRLGSSLIGISDMGPKVTEDFGVTEQDLTKAYDNAIKANALDFLRDYLPMSTLTHVGMSMNARSYENVIQKMLASPLAESVWIGKRMAQELGRLTPSLVKESGDPRSAAFQKFLKIRAQATSAIVDKIGAPASGGSGVDLVSYYGMGSGDPDVAAQVALAAPIIYTFSSGTSMRDAHKAAERLDRSARVELISAYIGERANRRHKPGRAFENLEYQFDLKGRIGIYRDIQRHRIGTQERQRFGVSLGYEVRDAFRDVGIAEDYCSNMDEVKGLYGALQERLPYQAQYAVTFGFNTRWYYRINARQLYHLCELRSSPQGHPDYRVLVQKMAAKVAAVHPTVTSKMTYLDSSEKSLGRLDSEIRIAVKKARLSGANPPR